MNKRKLLFLLVTLVLVGVAGALLTNNIHYPAEETLSNTPPRCVPHDIRSFTLMRLKSEGEERQIVFRRTDPVLRGVSESVKKLRAKWAIEMPITAEADANLVQRIVSSLCYIPRAFALRAGDASIPNNFPLRMEFFWADKGPPENWQFAFSNAPKSRRVVMRLRKGTEELFFSVPDFFMRLVGSQLLAYQNRRVMSAILDSVEVVTLKNKGQLKFTLERNGAEWLLIQEGKKNKLANESARKFVNRMATLRAVSVLQPNRERDCSVNGSDYSIEVKGRYIPDELITFRMEKSTACSSKRLETFSIHKDIENYLSVDPNEFL